jgi:flagellar hook-basal body complex protein FliE
MCQHNEHHAAELDQMAENLQKLGMQGAARAIREAVSDFQKGNMRLNLALTVLKDELK